MSYRDLPASKAGAPVEDDRPALLWRIMIVFAGVVLIWRGLGWLAEAFGPPEQDSFGQADRVGHAVRAVLATALTLPLVWLARRYLDRRSWETLGFATARGAWRQVFAGMALWSASAAVGALVALTIGGVRIETHGPPSRELVFLAIGLPALVFLYEALPEELVFRGYFYRNLASRFSRGLAVFAQAVLFTLWAWLIGAAASGERVFILFTFAIVLGIVRVLSGSIWAGVGYHLAFQWVAQWLVAATKDGFLAISDRATFEALTFGLFPIVVLVIVLKVKSPRTSRELWRVVEPDPAAAAAGSGSEKGAAGKATEPAPTSR